MLILNDPLIDQITMDKDARRMRAAAMRAGVHSARQVIAAKLSALFFRSGHTA